MAYEYVRKEMRILPLRSAVQMGSDVSLGSSVTPDRLFDLRQRTCGPMCECILTFTANSPSFAGEEHYIPVDPAGGHCYWSPI